VISITDGQIYLEPDLFFAGVRPAINVGISVSRVGGNAQVNAIKDKRVAGGLRLDLAAYRELEAFAQLGTELDKATQKQLDRGARLVELLKQKQSNPYPVEEQVVSVWAGTTGKLDKIKVEDVKTFEADFLGFLHHKYQGVLDGIRETGKLDDDARDTLDKAITEFGKEFASEEPVDDRRTDVGTEAEAEDLDADSVDQEQIKRQRR